MSDELQDRVTQLLQALGDEQEARESLLPLVYDQLRMIAQKRMSSERANHTLQATALVHEAYLKLIGDKEIAWENRAHFFATAAEAMRRILIDHARKHGSEKRGGGKPKAPISVVDLAAENDPDQILALDDAMTKLEAEDPRSAMVVRLRFYGGLSVEETADAMNVSPRTVMREWAFARARLYQLLERTSTA
jgi:RNA polymerase sigma factor (TIGR02999 family)